MCKVFKDVKMFKKSFHSAMNSQTPWASHGLCRLFGEPRERPRELSVRLLPGLHTISHVDIPTLPKWLPKWLDVSRCLTAFTFFSRSIQVFNSSVRLQVQLVHSHSNCFTMGNKCWKQTKNDKEWQRPHATTWKTAQSPVASRRGASRGIPRGMSCWPYGLRDRICLAV